MQLKVNICFLQGTACLLSKETGLSLEELKYELAYCNVRYLVENNIVTITRPYTYESKEQAEIVCKQLYKVALGNFGQVSSC